MLNKRNMCVCVCVNDSARAWLAKCYFVTCLTQSTGTLFALGIHACMCSGLHSLKSNCIFRLDLLFLLHISGWCYKNKSASRQGLCWSKAATLSSVVCQQDGSLGSLRLSRLKSGTKPLFTRILFLSSVFHLINDTLWQSVV